MSQISHPKQSEQYTLEMEALGRLTLPEAVLQQLDLKPGSRLILIVGEDGTLHLMSLREQVRKLRGILKNISPNRSLADELIQERRGVAIAQLGPLTKSFGFSFGDRTCLALGERLKLPVMTADRTWNNLNLGVQVNSIR